MINCLSLPVVPLLMYKSCVTVSLISSNASMFCLILISYSTTCTHAISKSAHSYIFAVLTVSLHSSICPAQAHLIAPASAHCSYLSIFLITQCEGCGVASTLSWKGPYGGVLIAAWGWCICVLVAAWGLYGGVHVAAW